MRFYLVAFLAILCAAGASVMAGELHVGNVENESKEENNISEEVADNIIWLSQINRVTRTGQYIDITLNKLDQHESCYFVTPNGVVNEEIEIAGVAIKNSSNYVSCRITIGPMEVSLLGTWALCGKYVTDREYERCLPVNITWNDFSSPSATWDTNERTLFNHSVNIGGYLTPGVTDSGSVMSCHVITPNDEDLVLTSDMEYPKIQRTGTSDCAVTIGPIEDWMLGSWTVYGQFRSVLLFSEVRLPMNMFLYDEENPYDQPYNVTNLNPFNRVINLGASTTAEVKGSGNTDSCQYTAPNREVYDFKAFHQFPGVAIVNVANTAVCRISIRPIDMNMLGEWQIVGKFSNNGIFTERRQPFHIIQEDPDNPIIENRVIENLTELFFDMQIGTKQMITIPKTTFVIPQSCHIRTPSGRQYTIMAGFNVEGVIVIDAPDAECGVFIYVTSEDMVGEWVLILRATMFSDEIERRLPFVIYVEEQVEAFPQELVVTEGNDMHIRLRNPTQHYDTCKLVAPREDTNSSHDIDAVNNTVCGFVVKTVDMSDEGTWEIVYGSKIVYKAPINVTVIAREAPQVYDLTLIKDREVNKYIGPEDAVYCKLEDPKGFAVFDGFGTCKLTIERVTMDQSGYWKMSVGLPGRVLLEEHIFMVTVEEAEPKAIVSTSIQRQQPSVILSCSVSSSHNVSACKFRDPKGTVLIAAQGVGEDKYSFYGSEVTLESEVKSHECGVRITNPSVADLGLWRCAIETEEDTYFGFLTVICPWLMDNPDVQASVVTEPILTTERASILAIEGEGVTMSCSIEAPIRYCYFRASNGTVFSVKPATSHHLMEYVGNGFDAGECGVRFKGLTWRDSGSWSCHVGLHNETEEHREQIQLAVLEPMTVRHYMHEYHGLVVEATVHSERTLVYCRFVRIDGIGFTTDSIPDGYRFIGSLEKGHCLLQILEVNMLSLHPWTIAVQIPGQDEELSRQTTDNLLWFEPEDCPRPVPIYLWIIVIVFSLCVLTLGVSLGPQKNREWTYKEASKLRNSFRNSYRKPKNIENV